MTFLIWRLRRAHAIVSAVVILAVTALIVPTGIAIANSCHHAVMNCSASHAGCGPCSAMIPAWPLNPAAHVGPAGPAGSTWRNIAGASVSVR